MARKFLAAAQPFFAPLRCEACGSDGAPGLCRTCLVQVKYVDSSACEICALPFAAEATTPHRCARCLSLPPVYDKASAAFEFAGPVPALLHAAKFNGCRLPLKLLAECARESFQAAVASLQPDLLCPVPLPFFRRLRRGFNQSYLLALDLNRVLPESLPFLGGVKRKWRAPQAKKGRDARLRALRGTMRYAGRTPLKGKRVLIVDDVMTTGSTAEALARELKSSGAARVDVFALARVRPHYPAM